jgi:hypothetical protein
MRLAEDEGEREENRGTLTVPFASAMSRRVMVITMRTLNFTCAEDVCDKMNLVETIKSKDEI